MSNKEIDLKEKIMERIKSGEIKMKPRWYFVFGSLASAAGLVSILVVTIFLVNFAIFSLRTNGYMRGYKYDQIIASFPWWALVLAVFGVLLGVVLLKKYDFSYKKNFSTIVLSLLVSLLIAGLLVNFLGINDVFARKGMMKKIYKRYDGRCGATMIKNEAGSKTRANPTRVFKDQFILEIS
ncbi:hypothetical protein GYA54_02595 [Candidatus Kuenenbacteria bacterium]|nr:hypothetical protein [Candidatus Kuenenbacteria bacterium]